MVASSSSFFIVQHQDLGLTLAFLATDVFFLALHIILYVVLSAAFCFCLPCIIAFMYYFNRQERASDGENQEPTKIQLYSVQC
uniref:Uncharacterized protein n=1 Tax=Helianthus annuus TaxID=4232 RepID=A0A251VG33_HELAN